MKPPLGCEEPRRSAPTQLARAQCGDCLIVRSEEVKDAAGVQLFVEVYMYRSCERLLVRDRHCDVRVTALASIVTALDIMHAYSHRR